MSKVTTSVLLALIAALALSSCANTVRGVGRDMSNTKDAVEDAAN